jgi:hypothetical protein
MSQHDVQTIRAFTGPLSPADKVFARVPLIDAGPSEVIPNDAQAPVDVGRMLDEGKWGRYQQRIVALTALTIIFDGADIQLLSVAIPAMMADWHVACGAFGPVLASGLVGMMIGGALGGIAGDRFGRRVALVGTLVVFGVLCRSRSR